jgi:hypothetical protein
MDDAFRAFESQFYNRSEFDKFYTSLVDCRLKDDFLRVASSYLFFVKCGDWHVNVPRSNPIIEYFTNSFKLVALIAIIESLSDKKHIDLYSWLLSKENLKEFPITGKEHLTSLYTKYKQDYGSIRRCKTFFENLPSKTKEDLRSAIKIEGKPAKNIKKVVDLIYRVRSGFAHENALNLEISNITCYANDGNKRVIWRMPMSLLETAFEEGVLIYFTNKRYSQ